MGNTSSRTPKASFGTLIGYGPHGVPCYSSRYLTLNWLTVIKEGGLSAYAVPYSHPAAAATSSPTAAATSSSEGEKIYTGVQWQCVEYARRWWICTHGLTFASVSFAYQLFDLEQFDMLPNVNIPTANTLQGTATPSTTEVQSPSSFSSSSSPTLSSPSSTSSPSLKSVPGVPVKKARNGSLESATTRPTVGALLLWHPAGYFRTTGHVAIVSNITSNAVEVAEQNVSDEVWPKGQGYSRALPYKLDPSTGVITIEDCLPGAKVLGWIAPSLMASS